MSFCSGCGAPTAVGANFCGKCGRTLVAPSPPARRRLPVSARVAIAVGVTLVLFLLVGKACGGPSDSDSSSGSEARELDAGAPGYISTGTKGVIVGTTRDNFGEITEAQRINDTLGLANLALAGRAFLLDDGAKVLVLGRSLDGLYQIRSLEGPTIGRSGWVPKEWVSKLPRSVLGPQTPVADRGSTKERLDYAAAASARRNAEGLSLVAIGDGLQVNSSRKLGAGDLGALARRLAKDPEVGKAGFVEVVVTDPEGNRWTESVK